MHKTTLKRGGWLCYESEGECLCFEVLKEKGHLCNLAFEKRNWECTSKNGSGYRKCKKFNYPLFYLSITLQNDLSMV